jgi:serine/threonine-protein kinase
VILYQLLTGTLPFRGANPVALLHAMQTVDPAPMRDARPEIPAPFEFVVRRALARKAADRYQSIREMLADLNPASGKSVLASAPAKTADTHTIAVLPLINISPDPENEYICDGLAEELTNGFTQIAGLRVVSRVSAFQCKGTSPDVREIGRRLGASLLVHGSLRRSGSSIRLTMQLSQTSEGYQNWAQDSPDSKLRERCPLRKPTIFICRGDLPSIRKPLKSSNVLSICSSKQRLPIPHSLLP